VLLRRADKPEQTVPIVLLQQFISAYGGTPLAKPSPTLTSVMNIKNVLYLINVNYNSSPATIIIPPASSPLSSLV